MSTINQTTTQQQTVVTEQTVPMINVRDLLHAKEEQINNDAAFRIAEIEKSCQRVIDNIESQKQEILRDIQFKRQQAELQLQQAQILRREADERQRRAAELVGQAPTSLGVAVQTASFEDTHVSSSAIQSAADQQPLLHTGPSSTSTVNKTQPITSTYNNPSIISQSQQQQTSGINAPLASTGPFGDAQTHAQQYNNNTWNNPAQAAAITQTQQSTASPRSTSTKSAIRQEGQNIKQDVKAEERKAENAVSSSSSTPSVPSTSAGGFLSSLKNVFMPQPPVPNDALAYEQQVNQQQQIQQPGEQQSLTQKTGAMNISAPIMQGSVSDRDMLRQSAQTTTRSA